MLSKDTARHCWLGLGAIFAVVLVFSASGPSTSRAANGEISNGSFESGTSPGSFTALFPGDPDIDDWEIVSGSIDYIGSYWQASDGSRSIDLNGDGQGAISTTFPTNAGSSYTVTFDMAGNPDGGPAVKTMEVDAGGAATVYAFDSSAFTTANMGWTQRTYDFVASSSSTTLTFASAISGFYGPALDNVSVVETSAHSRRGGNVGGAAGGVVVAVADQARENRERAAAAARPAATVQAPRTGTGVAIAPPNTGDGGLRGEPSQPWAPVAGLIGSLAVLALLQRVASPKHPS